MLAAEQEILLLGGLEPAGYLAAVLAQDCWQVELLANLDSLPESGAVLVAAWPKPQGGSGFPARVFAIH